MAACAGHAPSRFNNALEDAGVSVNVCLIFYHDIFSMEIMDPYMMIMLTYETSHDNVI